MILEEQLLPAHVRTERRLAYLESLVTSILRRLDTQLLSEPMLLPTTYVEHVRLPSVLYCSFCGKSQKEVRLIAAPTAAFICSECVELCTTILKDVS